MRLTQALYSALNASRRRASSSITRKPRLECRPLPVYLQPTHVADSNRKIIIDSLTPGHRAELRSVAHSLKPIFQIGKEGVTERAVEAVREAFNTREILKVKVLDSAPADARATGETLASSIEDAHLVQVIGRTVVLFRPVPETT